MVRAGVIAAAAGLAGSVFAAPTLDKRAAQANLDVAILQFALTLEHLENVFYKEAIQNFTLADFQAAGYSADYYNNLHYIAYDEQTHVEALEAALTAAGQKPVQPCTYDFPYTNVKSFITLSSMLESVGTSAYLGAAPLITDKDYLTVAGAILAVEALHTSYERAAIGEVPLQNPFQTPLDANSAYTLATEFIVSCPSTNYKLPFTAFKYLATDGTTCTCEEPNCGAPSAYIKRSESYRNGWGWGHPSSGSGSCKAPVAGADVTFTADGKVPAGSYVTFVNGLTVTSVHGKISGDNITAAIPSGLSGQTYAFVTSSSITTFSDSAVKYGPAIIEVTPPAPAIDYSES